jgi:hypothetical protein
VFWNLETLPSWTGQKFLFTFFLFYFIYFFAVLGGSQALWMLGVLSTTVLCSPEISKEES